MKIAFAVQHDNGLDSTVYNHFGSAPAFVMGGIRTPSRLSLSTTLT